MSPQDQTRNDRPTVRPGRGLPWTVLGLMLLDLAIPAYAGPGHHGFPQAIRAPQERAAPVERSAPPAQRSQPSQGIQGHGNTFVPRSGQNQGHLQQWMQAHSNLSLEEQQRALDAEPGFSQLKPDVQARLHQQLAQLNSMTPAQRQRAIERTETMEALKPEQRLQVRSALVGLGALPEDRRRFVGRMFRALRYMPDAERQAYLNSPAMRPQFTDQERLILNNLFAVGPYLPPPPVAPAQPAPQAPR